VPKVAQVLACFKVMPELDQCKKMMDMEGFLTQRIDKLKEQLHKAQREHVAAAPSCHSRIWGLARSCSSAWARGTR